MESRDVTKHRGFQRRCTTWSRARRERKGRENMVRRILERAWRQRTKHVRMMEDFSPCMFREPSVRPQFALTQRSVSHLARYVRAK